MRFRFNFVLPLLPALSGVSKALVGVGERGTDVESLHVISRLNRDYGGEGGDPRGKFFHESTFDSHYDGRFAENILSYDERRIRLTTLIQTYLSTMSDIGAETWIMHGSLLGWWWNRKIMPWDADVDVQMSYWSMKFLADFYNMTIHHYKLPGIEKGRDYLLEVNPHYVIDSIQDRLNVIDARWIDTEVGLFIDITVLRRNRTAEALGIEGVMMSKDGHSYLWGDIFPLRNSVFEHMPVKIPYAYSALLEEEYGPEALTRTDFEDHHFDQDRMEWMPLK